MADFRDDPVVLKDTVDEEQDRADWPLYQCKLETKCIAPQYYTVMYPTVESGAVKIKRSLFSELADEEIVAVACLLKSNSSRNDNEEDEQAICVPIKAQRLKKRRKKEEVQSTYIICDFILGSVVEVERLWSIYKFLLTENWSSITPRLFDTIVFLNIIVKVWDVTLVSEADNLTHSDEDSYRIAAHITQQELNDKIRARLI